MLFFFNLPFHLVSWSNPMPHHSAGHADRYFKHVSSVVWHYSGMCYSLTHFPKEEK